MILEKVLQGIHQPPLLLLEDCLDASAASLFHDLVRRARTTWHESRVVVVAAEDAPTTYLTGVDDPGHSLRVVDAFSDPYGWNPPSSSDPSTVLLSSSAEIDQLIRTLQPLATPSPVVLFVDALTSLVAQHTPTEMVRLLYGLREMFGSVIALVHSDTVDDLVLRHLRNSATTIATLLPAPSAAGHSIYAMCETLHRRPTTSPACGFRVEHELVYLREDVDGSTQVLETEKVGSSFSEAEAGATSARPVATFNLSLTEDQRAQRQGVVLPHDRRRHEAVPSNVDHDVEERYQRLKLHHEGGETKGRLVNVERDSDEEEDVEEDLDF